MRLLQNWQHIRLANACTKIGSGATPRGGETVYLDQGIAFIRSQNVYNGRFHWDGLARLGDDHAAELDGVTVEAGDVLLNITGDSVARCCRAPGDIVPARVSQHVTIIRPLQGVLRPAFLAYYLITPLMQTYLLSIAGSGGTRKALTKQMIEALEVPHPPLHVQDRVAEVLSAYDDLIENNTRRMALLEQSARLLYEEWFVRLRFPGREHTCITDGVPKGWRQVTIPEAVDVNPITRCRMTTNILGSKCPTLLRVRCSSAISSCDLAAAAASSSTAIR